MLIYDHRGGLSRVGRYYIEYYWNGNRCPVDNFVQSKDRKGMAKIDFFMDLLMEYGPNLQRPYAAYLRNKIWELRPGINDQNYRLFYFWINNKAVFVHAVDKKDFVQKDIDIAEKRMKEILQYLKR